jgi:hypothetical protein
MRLGWQVCVGKDENCVGDRQPAGIESVVHGLMVPGSATAASAFMLSECRLLHELQSKADTERYSDGLSEIAGRYF